MNRNYTTISLDLDTMEKLRVLADGKPIAKFIRDLVNNEESRLGIGQRLSAIESMLATGFEAISKSTSESRIDAESKR